MHHLSKSDFKIAQDCAKKLVYKKQKYPNSTDTNEYMEMLAEGGYLIGKYAQLLYPEGIEIRENNTDKAIELTTRLLEENDNVIIFEAAIRSNNKIVRVDILRKEASVLNIIEVKAKSFDSTKVNYKELDKYLDDIAYQTLVIKEAFPTLETHSFLLMPDKSRKLQIEGLMGWFKLNDSDQPKGSFRNFNIEFLYEGDEAKIDRLRNSSILSLLNVDVEVQNKLPFVANKTKQLLRVLSEGISPDDFQISKDCFNCEFKPSLDEDKNGFKECWGALAEVSPSISELYHAGTVGGKIPVINELIQEGKVSLFDFREEHFVNAKGEVGARGERQLIQLAYTKTNKEWSSDEMRHEVLGWKFPLYFIDFETFAGPIPHHAGMRPYETVAFQWSCHKISQPNATPEHFEWINIDYDFPNFRFAEALMNCIGSDGTVFMWATHENTVLRSIYDQMEERNYKNERLKVWLEQTVKFDKGDVGRLVDMNAFTLKHYFHPQMKGKTSIKKVLPAVWNNNPFLHEIPWLKKYHSSDDFGVIKSPYDALSQLLATLEETETVKDGTGAMRAYQEMMFGSSKSNPETRENWKQLLLQYCELDTMAMVIIWKYWYEKSKK